jgi:capsular exopolysaccharide synthesis family protein
LIILTDSLEELKMRRDEARERKRDLDIARVQYAKRLIIKEERKEQLNTIKEQIGKLKILHDDPETPKVQSLGHAPMPLEVSSPKWQVYFPGGTMLGLMCGVGLAFLIELANDLVRTPRDVGRYLHIPLLGVIPDADEDEQLDEDIDLCHVVRLAPYSLISESYRRFRTNLKLSGSAESSKVILISSGVARDGKTSIAVNLATAFVAESKKVLLVDANFWQPSLHTLFSNGQQQEESNGSDSDAAMENDQTGFGLSTLLSNECDYHQAIKPVDIENLNIIESGPLPVNPAELLGGAQMEKFINVQRKNYDYIIIDGPPVLLVSDTKMLAKLVDGTILVFNANTTRRGAALRTIRELRQVEANIAGCVLLALKAIKGGYFSEQFKSYHKYQKLQLARSI